MIGTATHLSSSLGWHLLLLACGIVVLVVGGRLLVGAAVEMARRLSIPSLVVGLTLVAWGTSAPELALGVSTSAAGHPEVAFGNVVGANICNMGLVLGLCALLRPLRVDERLVHVEVLVSAGLLLLLAAPGLLLGGYQRWHSALLLLLFATYSTMMVVRAAGARRPGEHLIPATAAESPPAPPAPWWRIAGLSLAGLVLLTFGGSLAGDSAVAIAESLGVSDAVIAVTIVSLGTTLPELVTSILSMRRGQVDLAVGGAVGSCIFNAGAIFGVAGLIAPPALAPGDSLSLATMVLLALLLIPFSRAFKHHIARVEGGLLLAIYLGFLATQGWIAANAR